MAKAELGPGKLCAVFGAGGLGGYGIQLAKLAGATVVAVDTAPEKLAEAKRLGADHVVLATEDPGSKIRDLGGADACLNFAPTTHVWAPINQAINPRGWIISIAMVAEPVPLNPEALTFNGVRITGTAVGGRQDLADILRLAAARQLQVEVTPIPLREVDAALDALATGDAIGRYVIDFSLD